MWASRLWHDRGMTLVRIWIIKLLHDPLYTLSVECFKGNTKVAITATTINDARLCLFSNYNGMRQRRKDNGPLPHSYLTKIQKLTVNRL